MKKRFRALILKSNLISVKMKTGKNKILKLLQILLKVKIQVTYI